MTPAGRISRPPPSVTIVGLGVIGASLCRALRAHLPETVITGIDPDEGLTRRARADGVCDRTGTSPELLAGSELVVICAPLEAIPDWLSRCSEHAPGALVTDTGSTKAWVLEAVRRLAPDLRFLGGHPMAGRERGGYDSAEATMFAGCTWVLTPTADTELTVFEPWLEALSAIGAHVELMSPELHDRAAVWASHLPLAVSSALLLAATEAPEWSIARWLTAGSFRDATRLAGGDPGLHASIAVSNQAALGPAIDDLVERLTALRDRLPEAGSVRDYFESARRAREDWLEARIRAGRPVP